MNEPEKINWRNSNMVKAYAESLGKGMSVVWISSRNKFNIIKTENEKNYKDLLVMHRT